MFHVISINFDAASVNSISCLLEIKKNSLIYGGKLIKNEKFLMVNKLLNNYLGISIFQTQCFITISLLFQTIYVYVYI